MAGYVDHPSLPSHPAFYFPHFILPPQQASPPHHLHASPEYYTSGDVNPAPTRRPRGRPLGTKNKPKPPLVLTSESPTSLQSYVLEFSPGSDILTLLTEHARQRGRGLSVLSGSGTVSDVSLRYSGCTSLLNLRGKFEILSLTGTVLPPPAPQGSSGLAMFMAGPQGEVVGGCVARRLVAAGPVMIVAASFSNAVYERLPLTEETEEGGWEGQQVGAASQASSITGEGGWIGDDSSTGFPDGVEFLGMYGPGML